MTPQIWAIARNTYTESIRQPIFVVMTGLVGLLLILALSVSAYTLDDDDKIMIDMCMSTMFFGGLILAAFTATGVLSREIDNKTVLTVISKPIGRPAFILGKYLGVAGAIGLAFWIWSLVFLLLTRHGVVSAAYDKIDWPVITLGLGSLLLAFGLAVWGNYFYGWVFCSRFSGLLAAGLPVAYLLVLMIDKDWNFQPITAEFTREESLLDQYLIALVLVLEGLAVLSAVAVACSTRLGQVMTLLVCSGVFALGLLSDYFFGQYVAQHPVAWAGYATVPNVQFNVLTDALTQRHPVSFRYVVLVSAYNALWLVAALGAAVALFQTRESG